MFVGAEKTIPLINNYLSRYTMGTLGSKFLNTVNINVGLGAEKTSITLNFSVSDLNNMTVPSNVDCVVLCFSTDKRVSHETRLKNLNTVLKAVACKVCILGLGQSNHGYIVTCDSDRILAQIRASVERCFNIEKPLYYIVADHLNNSGVYLAE
jgi:hypothetical protein